MYTFNYNVYQCGCYTQADYALFNDIVEYINDEIGDSRYYAVLAAKAPTRRARELLMEFGMEEQHHAENFMRVYASMMGKFYNPPPRQEPQVPDYIEALKVRTLAESGDFEKYALKYRQAVNPCLRALFYMTQASEGKHAMRIPMLMAER